MPIYNVPNNAQRIIVRLRATSADDIGGELRAGPNSLVSDSEIVAPTDRGHSVREWTVEVPRNYVLWPVGVPRADPTKTFVPAIYEVEADGVLIPAIGSNQPSTSILLTRTGEGPCTHDPILIVIV